MSTNKHQNNRDRNLRGAPKKGKQTGNPGAKPEYSRAYEKELLFESLRRLYTFEGMGEPHGF